MSAQFSRLNKVTEASPKSDIMAFLATCQEAAGDSLLEALFSAQSIKNMETLMDSDQPLFFNLPVVQAEKTGRKVGANKEANPWGITREDNTVLSIGYLKSYIQSRARLNDFPYNREENMKFFMSDEFLRDFAGSTAGVVCKAIRASTRWIDPSKPVPAPVVEPVAETPAPVDMTLTTEEQQKSVLDMVADETPATEPVAEPVAEMVDDMAGEPKPDLG